MRLLLDEMLNPQIAVQLRRRGHDVLAIQEEPSLQGRPDPEVLARATELRRALVTDNVTDFARLHRVVLTEGDHHAGILLAAPTTMRRSQKTIGLWVRTIDRQLKSLPEGSDMADTMIWLKP